MSFLSNVDVLSRLLQPGSQAARKGTQKRLAIGKAYNVDVDTDMLGKQKLNIDLTFATNLVPVVKLAIRLF